MSMVQLSKRLKIPQPTVNQSATRGEKITKENKLKLLQNNQLIRDIPYVVSGLQRAQQPIWSDDYNPLIGMKSCVSV